MDDYTKMSDDFAHLVEKIVGHRVVYLAWSNVDTFSGFAHLFGREFGQPVISSTTVAMVQAALEVLGFFFVAVVSVSC